MNKLFSSHILKFALFLLLPVLPAFARGDSEESASPDDTHYAAIIKIASEDAISQLEENGVEILRRRDELLLCYVPYAAQKKLSPLNSSLKTKRKPDGISKIEKGRRVNISMDNAREWFGASVINEGNADFPPFTGKGVVTGICDVGIDPLHIAFLDEKGEPRIKRVVQYKEGSGERIVMDSKEEYTAWQTDTPDNWHATHVANIMAGSYGPYRGMASGSDIVITTSQLTDVGLLCGAEDILEYARENGKRAVINMSMANYIGPHDGSSLFSQYLDRVAEEAIVVLSAGNAGNTNFTLPIDFSEATPSAALALYSSDWVQFNPYGAVDVWSPDDTPLKVRFGIFNGQDKENLIWYPWQKLAEGKTFKITSDSGQATSSDTETVLYDDTFSSIYDGWFSLTGGVDSENGRYRVIMEFDAHTGIESSKGPWAKFVPLIEVSGRPGSHADIYADWQFTNFRQIPGGAVPGSALSFSDLASGSNVISVGMFVNRARRPSLSGEDFIDNFNPGTVAQSSSHSTLIDGRVMPLTVAPGYNVISAISRPALQANPMEGLNAETVVDGEKYMWATNSGTSMSAPYAAGVLACWLEAVPTLTSAQAMDIISRSNRHDYPDPENPRHGQGWLDPAEGLRLALLSYAGTGTIFPEYPLDADRSDRRRLSFSGGTLYLWNPETLPSHINIYDISGKSVLSLPSSSAAEEFRLDPLSPGLYIATIADSNVNIKFIVNR